MRAPASGPTSIVLQRPNGKPSCETSSLVMPARMSRARGPHSPSVVQALVRSWIWALTVRRAGDP